MSKNFKVNDKVRIKATGEIGVVKGRDVISIDANKDFNKMVDVQYIVKISDGIDNWKAYTKKDLEKIHNYELPTKHEYIHTYDVVDGYKIILYSYVENYVPFDFPHSNGKELSIGYSIYNPNDEFNEKIGVRIARSRSKKKPFCRMFSCFGGEFNKDTVEAIMNVKADYIKNNFSKFISKEKHLNEKTEKSN